MKKMLKIFKNIYSFIKIILVIILIFVISVILIQRVFNNKISVFGYRIFTIVTASMEPEYKVFDVIISKDVNPEDLSIGDDVVYLGTKGDFRDKVITHRIIDINNDNGSYSFITQGIANSAPDPEIESSQIYGTVIQKSLILSFFSGILNTTAGFYFLILVPIAFLIALEIIDTIRDKSNGENQEN